MRKTKKGHRSRLAGHWNRRSPQPDQLERHILNFQSINSNEESPLMITWSHKANQKGFLRSKDETQLALSFYTRRIVLYQIFVLAREGVRPQIARTGNWSRRERKSNYKVFTFFVCSPCSTHVRKACKCAFRAGMLNKDWLNPRSILKDFLILSFWINKQKVKSS